MLCGREKEQAHSHAGFSFSKSRLTANLRGTALERTGCLLQVSEAGIRGCFTSLRLPRRLPHIPHPQTHSWVCASRVPQGSVTGASSYFGIASGRPRGKGRRRKREGAADEQAGKKKI